MPSELKKNVRYKEKSYFIELISLGIKLIQKHRMKK